MGFSLNGAPKSEIMEKEKFEMYSVIEVLKDYIERPQVIFTSIRSWIKAEIVFKLTLWSENLQYLPKLLGIRHMPASPRRPIIPWSIRVGATRIPFVGMTLEFKMYGKYREIKSLANQLRSFGGLNSRLLSHHRDTYPQIKLSVGHHTTLFTDGHTLGLCPLYNYRGYLPTSCLR